MRILLRVAVIAALLLIAHSRVLAQSVEDKIKVYQEQIASLNSQANTLSKQITLLDSQVKLTTLQIDDTRRKIDILDNEIGELTQEIVRLEDLKTKRLELVLHRIPQTYKRANASNFGGLLFSKNFSEFLTRAKYLLQVQEEDTQLYKQLQLTQTNYNERRDTRAEKKNEQEALRKQLEKHTRELASQKKQKQALLDQTRNSEVVYQSLLAQALAEKQALERALIDSVKVGPVKKGDPIALVGNSGYPGCSTGAHLHFEVRQGGAWIDPSSQPGNKTVKDDQNGGSDWSVGSGSWSWPVSDTIRLTQHFGKTPWSWRYSYSGGIHTGFDMVSTGGDVIRAPADGELYSSSQSCGSSIIKIKYIDHGSNLISFYLHVQ